MTAVVEPKASADAALASIAVGEIHPSPANPRRDVGDVGELADSIKELGIIEPLIVTPNGDGYVLVAGHRRHAAAIKAGVAEVPCIVRPGLDERAQAELRICENLHRSDLAPIEEAAAFQGLIDLGYSQRALAKKVSRSQAHISRRLSLLKLPAPAIDALDAGRITIELAKTGVTVIETIPTPAWKHRLDGLKVPADEQQDDDEAEEPADTPEEEAALSARRADRESAFAAQAERKARRSEAIEARRQFATIAIADVDAAGAVELTALLYAHCFYVEDPFDRQTADLLGLEKDTFNKTQAADQIKEYAAKGSRNRTRAVAAAAASLFEAMATPGPYSLADGSVRLHEEDDQAAARVWFAWLVERGYELTDHDRELIPEPEPPAEPQPDDAVAWYDDPEEGPRWVDESEAAAIEALDADRLHRVEPASGSDSAASDEGPKAEPAPTITVKKVGKRWTVTCSACGAVGHNTTEAYADERGRTHVDLDHRLVDAEAPA